MATSGSYRFSPSFESLIREAYSRIQIFPPSFQTQHIIDARMSGNLILSDYANRGASLWLIGDELLAIPTQPGVSTYACPSETVDIFDAYIRQYTPASSFGNIGNALTAVVMIPGQPAISAGGEPVVMAPGSGVFSTTQGSQVVTMNWPAHGLVDGSPIFFSTQVIAGPMTLPTWVIVDRVIDSNTVTFLAGAPAPATRPNVGGTPLLTTPTIGSAIVTVIQPGHGLVVGDAFTVPASFTLGGVALSGSVAVTYTVASVLSSYEFTFTAPAVATSIQTAFLNGGQIGVATQEAGTQWTDVFMWPLSRDEYAMLPNKQGPGRPTQFWFNRTIVPSLTLWPVPNAPPPGGTPTYFGFLAYRMRAVQDAIPTRGMTLDIPARFYLAFAAQLTAAVAEKYKPDAFAQKQALAEAAWERAARSDTERVSTYISPEVSGYFN